MYPEISYLTHDFTFHATSTKYPVPIIWISIPWTHFSIFPIIALKITEEFAFEEQGF